MLGVAFLEEGQTLAAACNDATLWLWDVRTPERPMPKRSEQQLGGHRGAVLGVAFSPDGQMLATAGADGTARLRDMGSRPRRAAATCSSVTRAPSTVSRSARTARGSPPSGATGRHACWSVETGEQLGRPVSDHCPVRGVAFHPHGDRLATAGLDGGWEPCEIESDDTMGLNEAAGVILHVPRTTSSLDRRRADRRLAALPRARGEEGPVAIRQVAGDRG